MTDWLTQNGPTIVLSSVLCGSLLYLIYYHDELDEDECTPVALLYRAAWWLAIMLAVSTTCVLVYLHGDTLWHALQCAVWLAGAAVLLLIRASEGDVMGDYATDDQAVTSTLVCSWIFENAIFLFVFLLAAEVFIDWPVWVWPSAALIGYLLAGWRIAHLEQDRAYLQLRRKGL